MSEIHIHRKKGFAFGEAYVNSKREPDNSGIYLLDVKGDATPTMQVFSFTAPLRHGSKYYKNRYEDKEKTVTVGIHANTVEQRRVIQRELLEKIIKAGRSKLVFLDEPGLFHWAEVFDGIGENEAEFMTELDIPFVCSYCKYGIEDKNIVLSSGANQLNNAGNLEAQTIIKITASSSGDVTVSGDSNSFKISGMTNGETVYIDSDNMVVYKMTGVAKASVMHRFTGKFITLTPGSNNITVSGTATAEVTASYNDTYIV